MVELKREAKIEELLSKVALFKNIQEQKPGWLEKLIAKLKLRTYRRNDFIIKKGEYGTSLHIIKEGEVQVLDDEHFIRKMKKRNYFGERGLISTTIE